MMKEVQKEDLLKKITVVFLLQCLHKLEQEIIEECRLNATKTPGNHYFQLW